MMREIASVTYMPSTVWPAPQTDHPDALKTKRSLVEVG